MALGAGSSSGEMANGHMNFNPQTGQLMYTSSGMTAQYPDGHDEVDVVNAGWGLTALNSRVGSTPTAQKTVTQNCLF